MKEGSASVRHEGIGRTLFGRLGIARKRRQPALHELRRKYFSFKELLHANNEALRILADLEDKLLNPEFLTMSYQRTRCTRIAVEVFKIIRNLEILTGRKASTLERTFDRLCREIEEELGRSALVDTKRFVAPLEEIRPEMRDAVGAKSANLAEMKNVLGLPVPEGFVITTLAYQRFYEYNRLAGWINSVKMNLDIHDPASARAASERIQRRSLEAEVPQDLGEAVLQAYRDLRRTCGAPLRLAVRSSALGEDSVQSSFAGLYESVLNVEEKGLLEAYKKVLASKYSVRAIYYKANKGIRDEDIPMCVCCLQMVDASASGVLYTQDPFHPDRIFVTAGWGLGPSIVLGEMSPETYVLDKKTGALLEKRRSNQSVMLVPGEDAGTVELPVPRDQADEPCLNPEELGILVQIARKLEAHYGCPQDVEFSLDERGRLSLLQTRPLAPVRTPETRGLALADVPEHAVLLRAAEAETACGGVGSGLSHRVKDAADLERFPATGGVLVARRLIPEWIGLLGRVKAIVTEVGSPTGHMASIAREFRVPMIVNARGAVERIPEGLWVTVDATHRIVYRGRIDAPENHDPQEDGPLKESPVYKSLAVVVSRIAPLNLTNPRDRSFRAASCKTLHDIMRFCHEEAINSMFAFNDTQTLRKGRVFQLKIQVPLSVFVVDLGGGLADVGEKQKEVNCEQVASIPFRALLVGMTTEGVRWAGHVPIGLRDFLSVFANTLYDPLKHEQELGARSYAIVSERYVNFSSRLGYHFSTVDAYCGETSNSNYITFRFKGGAASQDRRERRAEFIARVLKTRDFWVDQQGDLVNANYKKYSLEDTLAALTMLGRLMGCARQLDVVMESPAHVEYFANLFLNGRYDFFGQSGSSGSLP